MKKIMKEKKLNKSNKLNYITKKVTEWIIPKKNEENKKNKSFIRLLEILEKYIDICTIIFVDVQSEAIELWKELFKKGFSCCLLYGQMDKEDKIDNLEDFKKGKKNILVTTSI